MLRADPSRKRCAIYTRKSSEEGLEQEFNSLQAQCEACEAYIRSQRHEGWVSARTHYDDGGFSGGNMERPALQHLLADIRAGRIDIIIVYKVDRLTRSLADFARLVEVFDAQGVSFVSVTQQFNTTSSMGRLTLNVLLSFAQFEREVTGERIRDKIAASKKKGMWMGGKVPLGYDTSERTLAINSAETVREKFSCRSCEKITQPPAPFHAIARARAGASLLAMILYAKFGQHQPLNRQSDVYAREGVELDVSTLADWVGACSATLAPLVELIRRHVVAAARIHGDDTTVPVLAKNKTVTGRLWTYVRDDRPFGGSDPPAAMFFYSRDRSGEHPRRHLSGWAGILQADAYAGFGQLYEARRSPRPITEAACWAHGRRKFFVLADLRQVPLAIEAVRRIDEIFAVEREINGVGSEQRHAVRQDRVKLLVTALEGWMRTERARLSRHADTAKATDYMLKRWPAFTRFLDDGRICLTNNAAERALRGIALGRRAWLFAGSDRGGERAAAMFTLIETAKLNGVDPQAWLADVLRRIADHPASKLDELLPWNWMKPEHQAAAA
jgi:DNA invertase Pin-like site-specific DNA recombinase